MTPNYPITTDRAREFWESHHKLNRVKAIISFSLDSTDANNQLKRRGYTRAFRQRCIKTFSAYLNNPKMDKIPFSQDEWWKELQ